MHYSGNNPFIREGVHGKKWAPISVFLCLFSFFAFMGDVFAQDSANDAALLDAFVKARGKDIIAFDSKNIKQFWIDKSVVSRNDGIEVLLSPGKNGGFESIPLKIQLANVNETMDCKVTVITNRSDFSFSVMDSNKKILSSSAPEDDFIQYHVYSSLFHLEDTQNDSFNLLFSSKSVYPDELNLKKIVLSFSQNKNSSFLFSPGKIGLSMNNWIARSGSEMKANEDSSLVVNGVVSFDKKIIIPKKPISITGKVQNVDEADNTIRIGFRTYAKDRTPLRRNYYSYKGNNAIIKLLSSETGSNSITVDSCPTWGKGCYLAIGAREDSSDIPNQTLVPGTITDVKEKDNGTFEITLSAPLKEEISAGTLLRVHNPQEIYVNYVITKRLKPGEEYDLEAAIGKNESFFDYLPESFSKGTYLVEPVIVFEKKALIRDLSISY